jgi:hypothetical protein
VPRITLPPDYVKIDVGMLYDNFHITDGAKIFYMQIRGLAWGRGSTGWLSMNDLEELTGKKHAAIWGYMSALRKYRGLSWLTSGDGNFMYTFADCNSKKMETDQLQETGITSSSSLSNKDNLDSRKEEERATPKKWSPPKNRSDFPSSPKEAAEHPDIQVYFQVSRVLPVPTLYKIVIETIQLLRARHSVEDDALADLLKPYYISWCSRTTKDGALYNPNAVTWLTEWAVSGNIPPARAVEKVTISAAQSQEDYETNRQQARARMQAARQQIGGTTV